MREQSQEMPDFLHPSEGTRYLDAEELAHGGAASDGRHNAVVVIAVMRHGPARSIRAQDPRRAPRLGAPARSFGGGAPTGWATRCRGSLMHNVSGFGCSGWVARGKPEADSRDGEQGDRRRLRTRRPCTRRVELVPLACRRPDGQYLYERSDRSASSEIRSEGSFTIGSREHIPQPAALRRGPISGWSLPATRS